MSEVTATERRPRTKTRTWLLIAAAVAAVLAANAHLIYVATTSQPACVAHLKQGEGDAARSLFSAAQSSCSPAVAAGAGHS
jgi:uncharacterized membrane protein